MRSTRVSRINGEKLILIRNANARPPDRTAKHLADGNGARFPKRRWIVFMEDEEVFPRDPSGRIERPRVQGQIEINLFEDPRVGRENLGIEHNEMITITFAISAFRECYASAFGNAKTLENSFNWF